MLKNWEEYTFLALTIISLLLSFLAKAWRLRVGVFTLLSVWVYGQISSYFIRYLPLYMPSEIMVNFIVFYVFIQLHFKREGEDHEPMWPLAILLIEVVIFFSHIVYWVEGFKIYGLEYLYPSYKHLVHA